MLEPEVTELRELVLSVQSILNIATWVWDTHFAAETGFGLPRKPTQLAAVGYRPPLKPAPEIDVRTPMLTSGLRRSGIPSPRAYVVSGIPGPCLMWRVLSLRGIRETEHKPGLRMHIKNSYPLSHGDPEPT